MGVNFQETEFQKPISTFLKTWFKEFQHLTSTDLSYSRQDLTYKQDSARKPRVRIVQNGLR